jgi:hypothetical protein
VPGGAATVSTADFNGDGKPDLAVVWSGTSTSGVAILLGKGDGTFASEVSYPTGTYSSDATIADFNGDGNLDLAVVREPRKFDDFVRKGRWHLHYGGDNRCG